MKSIYQKITLLGFVALTVSGLSSCEKFLEENPPSELTSESYFQNQIEAEGSLNGVYAPLASLWGSTGIQMFILAEIGTDNASMGPNASEPNAATTEIDFHNYTATNGHVSNVWENAYLAINRANLVLEKVPGINMNEVLKKRILGEASFLRGLYYFYLVQLFGDVPLRTASSTGFDLPARTPKAQVYQQIENDLKFAEQNIQVLRYTGANTGRVSKVAAQALLAKVYLQQGKWQEAASKAREVIQTPGYSLWPIYAEVFNLPKNEHQRESIFEVSFNQDAGISTRSMINTTPRNERVGTDASRANWVATNNLYGIYNSRDQRRTTYTNPTNFVLDANNPSRALFFTNVGGDWYFRKFRDYSARDRNTNNNFIVLRFADMLLVLSEALNEMGGPNAEAILAYNTIKKRAGLNTAADTLVIAPVAISQSAFRDSVLLERRRELAFEGHRWFDLVRTNRLIEAVKAAKPSVNIAERNKLYPIPQRELDVNPNLTQNDY